jgi:hypothetical protein
LLGVLFAFSGGIGSVSLAEHMDRTIHGSKALVTVFHAPPLAVIPVIGQAENLAAKHKRLPAAASVIVAMFALTLTLAHVHV